MKVLLFEQSRLQTKVFSSKYIDDSHLQSQPCVCLLSLNQKETKGIMSFIKDEKCTSTLWLLQASHYLFSKKEQPNILGLVFFYQLCYHKKTSECVAFNKKKK